MLLTTQLVHTANEIWNISEDVDPFEAGIGFVVSRKKTADSSGKDALARRREQPHHALVGLETDGHRGRGASVFADTAEIGHIIRAALSPKLNRVIPLARVNAGLEDCGKPVTVGKVNRLAARFDVQIVKKPFIPLAT